MSKPKVIIFDSPDAKTAYRSALHASAYAADEGGYRCLLTTFTSIISENVNRFFALPLSANAYEPDAPIPEYLGHSPNSALKLFEDLILSKFGKSYYGRMMARRLHRDNISGVYLIHEYTYPESLLAVAHEIGIANMLIVRVAHATVEFNADDPVRSVEGFEANVILNGIKVINLPVVADYALAKLLVCGSIKDFLGIKD